MEHDRDSHVVNGDEEVHSQLRHWRVDAVPCVCLTMLRSISVQLKPAKYGHLHRRSNQLSHQLDYFVDQLAKLAELNTQLDTQVDENEFSHLQSPRSRRNACQR
jgi:hypothetical protein